MVITTADHPQRLINAYRSGTRGEEYTKEVMKLSFDTLLSSLGVIPPCGPTCGAHRRTSHFLQPEVRKSVLNFILDHGYKEKPERDQIIMTIYRCELIGGKKNAKLHFPIPYVNDYDTPALIACVISPFIPFLESKNQLGKPTVSKRQNQQLQNHTAIVAKAENASTTQPTTARLYSLCEISSPILRNRASRVQQESLGRKLAKQQTTIMMIKQSGFP